MPDDDPGMESEKSNCLLNSSFFWIYIVDSLLYKWTIGIGSSTNSLLASIGKICGLRLRELYEDVNIRRIMIVGFDWKLTIFTEKWKHIHKMTII